jgi:hypothetical protein
VDDAGDTYQFVRCYRHLGAEVVVARPPVGAEPFLTVVLVAGGSETDLIDVLTCLAAQDDPDFEVLIACGRDRSVADTVGSVIDTFAPEFAGWVRPIERDQTSASFERAVHQARGRYISVLRDDQVVSADWVSEFRAGAAGAAGRAVRCRGTTQLHVRDAPRQALRAITGFESVTPVDFELLGHLHTNGTPFGTFAAPRGAVETLRLPRVDDVGEVDEWEFVMRLTSRTGVVSRAAVTSGRRVLAGSTRAQETTAAAVDRLVERLDATPLLLPSGSVGRLVALTRAAEDNQLASASDRARVAAIERSRYWRATAPVRRLSSAVRLLSTARRARGT